MIKYILVIFNLLFSTTIQANINSATIVQDTLAALPNCLHYQLPTDFCVWVSHLGKVNTTPILSHYLPDLVVSVFDKPHDNPWSEVNKTLDSVGQPIQKNIIKNLTNMPVGSGSHNLQNQQERDVMFKEADVIGNPALLFMPAHGLLPSTVTPWMPYFQSMSDSVLWRGIPPFSLAEEGMALALNITHHVGTGLTNWGGIYPHEGKVINDNDAKAAMVIAQRATDLITHQKAIGHIHKTLSLQCGKHCKARAVQENSKETYFQMIYPVMQNSCYILGSNESYASNMLNKSGAYVWIVWRHYEGCSDGDGKYIGRI